MKKILCYIGLTTLIVFQVFYLTPELSGRESSAEWGVSALCLPHAEVTAPQSVQVRVAFSSAREGPELTAFMNVLGTPSFTSVTGIGYWGVPQRKWVSFLFEGPPMTNKYFCHTEWGDKQLHLRYEQTSNLKIFLSTSNTPSNVELDVLESSRGSVLVLRPQEGSTTYSSGAGSNNPYWLQFAIPIYDVRSATSTLFADFQ